MERLVDLSSLDYELRCWLQRAPASATVILLEAIRDELESQNRAHRSALAQCRGQDLRMVEELAFRTRALCLALCAGYRGKDDEQFETQRVCRQKIARAAGRRGATMMDLSSLDYKIRYWLRHVPLSAIVILLEAIRHELESRTAAGSHRLAG